MNKGGKKRLRIFAGPNGSGKTTLVNQVKETKISTKKIPLGFFLNADLIEKELKDTGKYSFLKAKIKVRSDEWNKFIDEAEAQRPVLRPIVRKKLKIADGKLSISSKYVDSYLAMRIAEFIRFSFIRKGVSFSFETVMSDASKIDFMRLARQKGYRVYLYFIATDDPVVNIDRVRSRVKKKGHNVHTDRIVKRYRKSLNNLFDAVLLTSRAYIFDNTRTIKLMAEITGGREIEVIEMDSPFWLYEHFYKKVLDRAP